MNKKNLNKFVENKLATLLNEERNFESFFKIMFLEKDNILYEKSEGYRITCTSYGEAYDMIYQRAAGIQSLCPELEHDTIIGLYMNNSLDWILIFWAIILSGCRPLLLNTRLPKSVTEEILQQADVRTIICDIAEFTGTRTITLEQISACTDSYKRVKFGSELIFMTSGTTGCPKLCYYSANEVINQISDSVTLIKDNPLFKKHYNGELKQLTFLPFYHIFGFFAVYMWFAFFSRSFVELADYSPETIVNTIRRHNVTHIFAVPLFWDTVYDKAINTIQDRGDKVYQKYLKGRRIEKALEAIPPLANLFSKLAFKEIRDNLFGESVQIMISGGGNISTEVLSFFNAIGYHLSNGYGTSEIGIICVERNMKKKVLNKGYVGKPFSSVKCKINEDGELLISSSTMARAVYLNGEAAPKSEWFNTHDLASIIGGDVQIIGRSEDLVVGEDGENLNPNYIESLFSDFPRNTVCLVEKQQEGKSVPTLVVSANGSVSQQQYDNLYRSSKEIILANNLGSAIKEIVVTDYQLIEDGDIKISRTKIKNALSKGKIGKAKIRTSENNILNETEQQIREIVAAVLGKDAGSIGVETDFFLDEGGTSLDYFAIVTKIKEEYGVDFPNESGNSLNTIRQMSDYVIKAGRNVN